MTTTAVSVSSELERLLMEVAKQLQLTETAQRAVRKHYAALSKYLTEGNLARYEPSLYPQGSFRIGTTVRPIGRDEFDLDFIVELMTSPSNDPATVYEVVAVELERYPDHAGRTERKPRCIRLNYPGQYHIDAVPAVPSGRAILIPDKTASGLGWRYTDPKGYVQWFEAAGRAGRAEKYAAVEPLPPEEGLQAKAALQIAVQLLKRHHQLHATAEKLRTPSVVLTTIAGLEAAGHEPLGSCMNDVVHGALDYARSRRHVYHPTAQDEILSEKWNDASVFAQYQSTAELLSKQWEQLVASQGEGLPVTTNLLNSMFGQEPVTRAIKAIGSEDGAMKKAGRLYTGAGGFVSIVPKGQGDRKSTFFGDA